MKQSAGVLAYRIRDARIDYFLVHPGGPFWKNRDAGAWSIPKGEFTSGEVAEEAARREFREETGIVLKGNLKPLPVVKQNAGKWIHAFYAKKDFDASVIISNEFDFEWPPRSGKMIRIPEIDRGEWFPIEVARIKIIAGQLPLLNDLNRILES